MIIAIVHAVSALEAIIIFMNIELIYLYASSEIVLLKQSIRGRIQKKGRTKDLGAL